ncbi:MAG: hypothetical protein ACK2U5_16270, partial [Candidatus Promineifilaceae bacterium]
AILEIRKIDNKDWTNLFPPRKSFWRLTAGTSACFTIPVSYSIKQAARRGIFCSGIFRKDWSNLLI